MADAPAVSWLKHHYDQAIVTLAVILLSASVGYLLVNVHRQRALLADAAGFVVGPGLPMSPVDMTPLEERASALARPKQVPLQGRNLLVSDLRVACVNPDCAKPIPYAATICPFCGVHQPEPGVVERRLDTDGDGLPDWWEEKYFGGPTAAVAHEDSDGDGFTNLEEFLAGTDPTDPNSYPPPRIRLVGARSRPFNMIFQAASFLDPERPIFQLNMLTSDRTYFAELGEVLEGYLVERYEPDAREGPTLILRQGAREIPLIRGVVRRHDQWMARLVTMQDMRQHDVIHGATFRILADEYKVVDIGSTEVVIENVRTEEKFTVPRLSGEEREELQRRRSGDTQRRPAVPAPAPAAEDLFGL